MPPPENVATSLYQKLYVALNFLLMSLSHAMGQRSVTRTNNFLFRLVPSSTRARPARIALLVPAPTPQCGFPQPAPCMTLINVLYSFFEGDAYRIVSNIPYTNITVQVKQKPYKNLL